MERKAVLVAVFCLGFIHVDSRPAESKVFNNCFRFQHLQSFPEHNCGTNNPDLEQGDILKKQRTTRHSVSNYQQIWTTNQVPYTFQNVYTQNEIQYITSIMNYVSYSTNGCFRFTPRNTEKDFVYIQKLDGCYSEVGRMGGQQTLSIGTNCYRNGTIMHELLHTLGFWHEHTRPDRDKYIRINTDNIETDHLKDYNAMDKDDVRILDEYDITSVMHYSQYTFAINNEVSTFEPLFQVESSLPIGQRITLTDLDIRKLKKLYNCDNLRPCPDPEVLPYVVITKLSSNNNIGATIRISCSTKGYALAGPPERFCRNDGRWSGEIPVCLPYSYKDPVYFCTFDQGTCNWINANWTRKTGTTETDFTGPVFDHTFETSNGYFMYAETSDPAKPGDKFRMTFRNDASSYYLRYYGGTCMSFYKSMHGKGIVPGALKIIVRDDTGETEIWKDDGTQSTDAILSNKWLRVDILQQMEPRTIRGAMYIIIEVTRGTSWLSDIAVDDVLIASCSKVKQYVSKLPKSATSISRPGTIISIG